MNTKRKKSFRAVKYTLFVCCYIFWVRACLGINVFLLIYWANMPAIVLFICWQGGYYYYCLHLHVKHMHIELYFNCVLTACCWSNLSKSCVWLCFILMELCLYCRYFKCMSFVVLKVFSAVLIAVGIYAKVAKESGI